MTFGRDGDPLYTYHGPPCDCWRHCYQREDFNEFLDYIREIAIDTPDGVGKNLSLLFLDLKLDPLDQRAKMHAGQELAKSISTHLFVDTDDSLDDANTNEKEPNGTSSINKLKKAPLNLILSVNHVQDIDLIHNFIHYLEINNCSHLLSRIGFDVGMNDDLQSIEAMWSRFGPNVNLWQGDGYTNCFSPFYNLERLTKALGKRDQVKGFPAKVYHWTIDLHDRIRESLRLGVDAIMTNHPERVLNVLQDPELAHSFRLATREDNPFKKLTRDHVGRANGETARYQRSASTASGGFLMNLFDVFSSWLNYVREIPFLSLPTTIVPSPARQNLRNRVKQTNNNQVENVTMVKLQSQSPEYSVDSGDQLLDRESQLNMTTQPAEPPYEGPSWYTALASNVLVSIMKMILPT